MILSLSSQTNAQPSTSQTTLAEALAKTVPRETPAPPAQVIDSVAQRLRREFDTWLEKPEAYRQRALKDRAIFPEGGIYPFAIPAMAYANLAFKNPAERDPVQKRMRILLDLVIPIVTARMNPPDKDLLNLTSYRRQGTYLATLNLALGYYVLATGDTRYETLHHHLSDLLFNTLQKLNGQPLASYPDCTWYFDTLMALVSCCLADELQALPAMIAVAQLTGGRVGHLDGGQLKFDTALTTGFFYGDAPHNL